MHNQWFENNKHSKLYFSIIEKAKQCEKSKDDDYFESHHILPESCGGENSETVLLTAREHFICHLLLPKVMSSEEHKQKMIFALSFMRKRFKSSILYEAFRKEHAMQMSMLMIGKPKSEETKQKMKGPKTEEHKAEIKRVKNLPASKENMSKKMTEIRAERTGEWKTTAGMVREDLTAYNKSFKGKKRPEISKAKKGVPNPKNSAIKKGKVNAVDLLGNVMIVSSEEFHSNPDLVGIKANEGQRRIKMRLDSQIAS